MENLVPTTEEILTEYGFDGGGFAKEKVRQMLIKFAQLHVVQALSCAASNATTEDIGNPGPDGWSEHIIVDEDSIKNSYPLTNIK